MTCRYIHRLTVGDRSFRSVFVRRVRRDSGTGSTSITFSSFFNPRRKFSYKQEAISSYTLSPGDKVKSRQTQISGMLLNFQNLTLQSLLVNVKTRPARCMKRVDFEVSSATAVPNESTASPLPHSEPSKEAHYMDELMEVLADTDYAKSDIKSTLIRAFKKACDITCFYRPYANLTESSRRFLLSQGLIRGRTRVPGPVKAIYEHPIVKAAVKFLTSTITEVKKYVKRNLPSILPTRLGLDLYFVKAKASSIDAPRPSNTFGPVTSEWQRIENIVKSNNDGIIAEQPDSALVSRNKNLSDKTSRRTPVALPVEFKRTITERQFIQQYLSRPLTRVISQIERSSHFSREDEFALSDLLEFIDRTRRIGLYDPIDKRLAQFLYSRLSSSQLNSFKEPILYRDSQRDHGYSRRDF